MSEGHGDPPADVRSFLPRPGEPVEQYAERLRALHRDLTLVLEAVERGLAAAADPEALAPPVPAHEPVDVVPVVEAPPAEDEEARAPAPPRFRRARARVEVLPAASGESGRDDPADLRRRREDDVPAGEPEASWAQAPPGPEASGEPEAPRPPRFPRRPSDAAAEQPPPDEPRWVEPPAAASGEHLTAPTFPEAGTPAAPAPRLAVPPWLIAAFFAAWLVVVALLVALLVS